MNDKLLKVPENFCIAPFYSHGKHIQWSEENVNIKKAWGKVFFAHDIAHYLNEKTDTPWQDPSIVIKEGLFNWKNDGLPLITDSFKERDRKGAKPIMVKYLSIYIQMMHWVGGSSVTTLEGVARNLQEFPYAPINIEERLQYIMDIPDHHHSFTTLTQLFEETEKKWAVYLLKLNKNN